MNNLLEVRDLWVEGCPPGGDYIPIVKGVNFSVKQGEVLALIGESGSGKSTISLSTMGYARPGCRISKGEVLLKGEDVMLLDTQSRRELRGTRIAYVAQSAAASFNPSLRLNKQVIEALTLCGLMQENEAIKHVIDLYHRLELPNPKTIGKRYPHQVSGGQLQRLMAAMALSCSPDLLVLDEPTTALDVTTQIEVLKAFKEIISRENTAAIYITHDLAVVAQVADQIVVLNNGEAVEQGRTEQIINNPKHEYTKTLMSAVRQTPSIVHIYKEKDQQEGIHLLEVRKISAAYGPLTILNDVSVIVDKMESIGVIGESGCGKSTLAKVISGIMPPSTGEITLTGSVLDGTYRKRSREDLKRIQFVFQMADVALNPRQTIGKILDRPLKFYHEMTQTQRNQRVEELLELVELSSDFADRFPGELSGGQKQRVNLARALAAEPDVILCDEVTSALDTVVAASVIKLLESLQKRLGVSYIFISHDLSTVAAFADRIVVLYAGRIVEQGPTSRVLSPPFHPYTKLLLSSVPELRQGWLEDITATEEARSGIAKDVTVSSVGCSFTDRCPMSIKGVCNTQIPPIQRPVGGHEIACHREIVELNKGIYKAEFDEFV
jgi:peptide/nickel transport system ATP-binding protein